MSEASLEQMAAASDEHLVAGREIHLPDMRGYRFCEVGLISGTSQDNAIANIWNTTGAWDPTDEQFDALDADAIARENGALRAWLNPVRRWMFDRLDVWEAGDDKSFGGITGTWMGVADAATMIAGHSPGQLPPWLHVPQEHLHLRPRQPRSTCSTPPTVRRSSCNPPLSTGRRC